MNQAQYLAGSTADFRDWLAERLCGQPIGFAIAGVVYPNLRSALDAYSWPRAQRAGLPNPDNGLPHIHPIVPTLAAHSSLAENTIVLHIIQQARHSAFAAGSANAHELSGAVASVFHWGGVYTEPHPGQGNRGWLTAKHDGLFTILESVVLDHATGNDTSAVAGLRFNSGMTKVYSLLIDDFIMYDSLVAAALAWFAMRWWTIESGNPAGTLPAPLRFACPPTNGNMAPYRNPDATLFPNLAENPYMHYTCNVRANWLLKGALIGAGPCSYFCSLREVEAALFQMGYRVI